MNKRIKELDQQAVDYANNVCDANGIYKGKEYLTVVKEKFAELIVKECIVHGKLTQSQTVVNGSEEYNAGREMGIEVFMNQIRKHFGVKE